MTACPTSQALLRSGSSPTADRLLAPGGGAMFVFLLVILAAVVLGIVGAVAKGLFYLLLIGCVLVAADIVYGVVRLRRPNQRQR
jgi:hypothetical protein